ncbi:nitroreductase/quinone reductase family protein [Streptomyces sp. MJM1172]|uniref:nitroreductase/quinone reductase family protein n=1 Tax=Streptomyces sp. MJM1172 TaxID=1703926 RepID=UPI000A684EEC|nr:nitroreductase/quinone reductase family protein [Streptomyces sp. MJM1172]
MSFNQAVIEEFRANAGRVGGPFEGAGLILLTTTGARSGREHTTPLGRPRGPGGQGMYVVASAGGSDRHPDWYRNLLARPLVRVETGTEVYEAVAVPAEGARREELFAHIVREEPGYGEYQRKTRRVIPVVELQRTHEAEGAEDAESAEDGIAGMLTRVHGWLRAQIAELLRLPAGESAPVGMQLRQHCLAFCQTLEAHHTGEDTGLFPWLAERHPQLAGFFRRLEEEHRDIERTQTRIAGLIRGGGDQAAVREELEALSRELLAHLDREEAELLPVLRALAA